jgi:hypothetical protein
VHRDYGAHGPFDREAKEFSTQLWADTHRGWLAVAGAVAVGLCVALMTKTKKNGRR